MAVRGTTSFVYFTDKSLGSGASGNVFFGRHKRKGTPCAVKSFRGDAGTKELQAREREFEVMRRLKHENVVQFISIEPESQGNNHVLVMELCTGGSLFKILEEPENAFGFDEEEFIIFLRDITQALQYMRREKIVHRDIKPGNILRHIKDDSGSVYKLTDFGAARELQHGDDEFMSLCGTEEYLHPAVFERALLAGQKGKFNASIDLWSLGVTIFHVATGHLPFQSHGGRRNREDMYRIISQKGPGVISGIQYQKDAEITWSRDLPASCRLSRGLKKHLVPMLARLLESDSRKQCTYDQFFNHSDDLTSRPVLHVFCLSTCRQDRLYVCADERSSEAHLRDALADLTELPDARHRYIHDSLRLSDLLVIDTSSRPITFIDSPFYVVPLTASTNDVWTKTVNDIVSHPDSSSDSPSDDVSVARAACAFTLYMTRQVDQLNRVQAHIIKTVNLLHRSLSSSALEMQASVQTVLVVIQSLTEVATDPSRAVQLRQKQQELTGVLSRVLKTSLPSGFLRCSSICQRNLCHNTMKRCAKELKQIYGSFNDQKKKNLSYNDEQIHKFDRLRISSIVKRASVQYDRCMNNTDKLLKQFHSWFCIYMQEQESIDQADMIDDFQQQLRINLFELKHPPSQIASPNDASCQTNDVELLGSVFDKKNIIKVRLDDLLSNSSDAIAWRYNPPVSNIQIIGTSDLFDRPSNIVGEFQEAATNLSGANCRNVHRSKNIGNNVMEYCESNFDSAYDSHSHVGSTRAVDGNKSVISGVISLIESSGIREAELVSRGFEYDKIMQESSQVVVGASRGDTVRQGCSPSRMDHASSDSAGHGGSQSMMDRAPNDPVRSQMYNISQQLSQLNTILAQNEGILSSAQLEIGINEVLLNRLCDCQPNDNRDK